MWANVNNCVGCAIPCIHCGAKSVETCFCDVCGVVIATEERYEYDGDDYCKDCLLETTHLESVPNGTVCDNCGCDLDEIDAYKLGDFILCEDCILDETKNKE